MLVLTRKQSEEVVMRTPEGREIVVRVLWIQGRGVQLGVTADRDVGVYRKEILPREAA